MTNKMFLTQKEIISLLSISKPNFLEKARFVGLKPDESKGLKPMFYEAEEAIHLISSYHAKKAALEAEKAASLFVKLKKQI